MERVEFFVGIVHSDVTYVGGRDGVPYQLANKINCWLQDNPKIEITRVLQSSAGDQLVLTIFFKTN